MVVVGVGTGWEEEGLRGDVQEEEDEEEEEAVLLLLLGMVVSSTVGVGGWLAAPVALHHEC